MNSSEVKKKLLNGKVSHQLRQRQLKAFVTTHLSVIEEIHKEGVMTYAELAQRIQDEFSIHCTATGLRNAVYRARKARKERGEPIASYQPKNRDYTPSEKVNAQENQHSGIKLENPLIQAMKEGKVQKQEDIPMMRVHTFDS